MGRLGRATTGLSTGNLWVPGWLRTPINFVIIVIIVIIYFIKVKFK